MQRLQKTPSHCILILCLFFLCVSCSKDRFQQSKTDVNILLQFENSSFQPSPSQKETDPAASTVHSLLSQILANDSEILKLSLDIEKEQVGIEQSKSINLPRIDIVASNYGVYRNDEGWDDYPDLGLVVKYNLNAIIFQSDLLAVAQAKKNILQLKKKLTIKKSLKDTVELLADFLYKSQILSELQRIRVIDNNLYEIRKNISTLLPNSIDFNNRKSNLQRSTLESKILEVKNQLADVKSILSVKASREITLSDSEQIHSYLNNVVESAIHIRNEKQLSQLFKESLHNNNLLSIFENQLYLVQMDKLKVERQKLPQIQTSFGGGSFTDIETKEINNFMWKFEIRIPLFDNGDIDRKLQVKNILEKRKKQEIQHEIQRQWLSLKRAYQKLSTTEKQVALITTDHENLKKVSDAISTSSNKNLTGSDEKLSTERQMRITRTTLLEKQLRHIKSAFNFTYFSGLSFQHTYSPMKRPREFDG